MPSVKLYKLNTVLHYYLFLTLYRMPSVKWSSRTVQGGDIEPLLTRAYPEVRFIINEVIIV